MNQEPLGPIQLYHRLMYWAEGTKPRQESGFELHLDTITAFQRELEQGVEGLTRQKTPGFTRYRTVIPDQGAVYVFFRELSLWQSCFGAPEAKFTLATNRKELLAPMAQRYHLSYDSKQMDTDTFARLA